MNEYSYDYKIGVGGVTTITTSGFYVVTNGVEMGVKYFESGEVLHDEMFTYGILPNEFKLPPL